MMMMKTCVGYRSALVAPRKTVERRGHGCGACRSGGGPVIDRGQNERKGCACQRCIGDGVMVRLEVLYPWGTGNIYGLLSTSNALW
jgi:hypothetical protein